MAVDDPSVSVSSGSPSATDAVATDPREGLVERTRRALGAVHPAAQLTAVGIVAFSILFGSLGVRHYHAFASWSFDLGIYDQAFWLVSRGGQTFMTVRGLEFWGHHLNLVAILYAPFYWLGAGPSFLYVSQAIIIGLGAMPVYLIARDRFRQPWMGLVFAVVYLLYAPVQWLTWVNFHPEALVVTPFLFAWWYARQQRWTGCFVFLLLALSTREDVALAVLVMGVVLVVLHRRDRPGRGKGWAVFGLGAAWYVLSTQVLIRYFNNGDQPFYVKQYYGNYGDTMPEVIRTMLRHPNRVISDSTQPDRLRFYRDLVVPLGGLPIVGALMLLMAVPQLVASAIGLSPYARSIHYQYTSVMIAPLVIAALEGGAWVWRRFPHVKKVLPVWVLVIALVTNIAWSPSPIGDHYGVWAKPSARNDVMQEAVDLVPSKASVTATYNLLTHLAHREEIYDWPNPWRGANWGADDRTRLPDPATVDYVVLDRHLIGANEAPLADAILAPGGDFEVIFDEADIVVARRTEPGAVSP